MNMIAAPPSGESAPRPPSSPGTPGGDKRRRGNQELLALLIGAIIIVGLVVVSGPLFSSVERKGSSIASGWPFMLIGAGFGIVGALAVLAVAKRLALHLTRSVQIGVIIIGAALGALLGFAAAPPAVEAEDVSKLTEEEIERREEAYGNIGDDATSGFIDADGDGVPDVDENGDPIIGLDTDGDGIPDTRLIPCPPGSPIGTEVGLYSPSRAISEPGVGLVASRALPQSPEPPRIIDTECDGTPEFSVPFNDAPFADLPPGGFGQLPDDAVPGDGAPDDYGDGAPDDYGDGAPDDYGDGNWEDWSESPSPDTIAPDERAERADQQSGFSIGKLLRFVLIGALILGLVGVLLWLATRFSDRSDDDTTNDEPSEPEQRLPPPTRPAQFGQSIDEMMADPDPRTGIIAAYGRLLMGFDEMGVGRQPQEGPQEHLERALASCSADPQASRELANWFAVARFSDHPVTEEDRQHAIGALRRVVDSIAPRPSAAPVMAIATPTPPAT